MLGKRLEEGELKLRSAQLTMTMTVTTPRAELRLYIHTQNTVNIFFSTSAVGVK